MLELVLLFQVFVAQIPSISSKSLSYITSSGFASNMVFLSITKRDFNIYKYIHKKENKPHFNDEKLVYIYGNRRRFRVCEENTGDEANEVSDRLLEFRKKTSHAYQIDTQKYILELSCYPGAYNVYKEYYLYSITNYGIEIKPLLLISSDGEELNFNGQFLPLWEYKKGIRALPTFDRELF
ncbi:hypothetical protein [Microcystis sp. M158S2]|uniref:hypothetical protein n=1 Tax=Microcystis sp. M158S2 TaxID=2771152 RepID=UPI00258D6ABC|nr:hypothetical protein [Microcystis sp. M158S2]MCA2736323.1 hypothetical protein [Microcystis sp. M158S2]